jgi:hypothetical protein
MLLMGEYANSRFARGLCKFGLVHFDTSMMALATLNTGAAP